METTDGSPLRIGKYNIIRTLGSGGMGVVYLAHDPVIDRRVALKTVHKDLLTKGGSGELAARFRNEAIAAGRLSHGGIVAVYDYGEDGPTAYIVMEYVDGETLADVSARSPLPLADVLGISDDLSDALAYAHDAGVVHRDIKPSNVMIANGRAKITDFGVARLATSTLTQDGVMVGTPNYMAPEQFRGETVDRRADLYSYAVLLFELLTGRVPFVGSQVAELAYRVCHEAPPNPTQLSPHLPRQVDALMARALAKAREDRFEGARELGKAVRAALGGAVAFGMASTALAPSPLIATPATNSTPALFEATVLRELEAALAPFVGPLAPAIIRRSAGKTADPEKLIELLSAAVSEPAAHGMLVRALQKALGRGTDPARPKTAPPGPAEAAAPAVAAVSSKERARITNALAQAIGPIASVIVQKAAPQATGYRDLCVRVSERLATKEDRAKFLAAVGVTNPAPKV